MSVTELPAQIPDPLRPLGPEGLKLWDRVWGLHKPWIQREADLDHVQLLCESMDERVALRYLVLSKEGTYRERIALRKLDEQIDLRIGNLGLNPADRKRLGLREETTGGKLAALRAARDA